MGDLRGARVPPAGTAAFRTLLENLDDGLYTLDREGRFTFVNDFIARSSGYPAEAFVGRSFLELIRAEDHAMVQANFELALSGERVPPYELAYRTASGQEMWVEVATAPLEHEGEIIGVLGLSHNVQRRKQAERALGEIVANHQALVDALPHGVAVLQDDKFVFVNRRLAEIVGVSAEELQCSDPFQFISRAFQRQLRDRMEQRMAGASDLPAISRAVLQRADGEPFDAELHATLTRFADRPAVQVLVTDISERLRMEEQIRHAQKMEAMGNLAGGIAHDFNNLLTGILGTASLLRRRDDVRDAAELIEKSALHAAALTRQLLGFARKEQPLFQITDVHETVLDVIRLLDRTLDKEFVVHSELAAPRALVRGDSGQLQQVFMNLILNARDAMPGGGRIAVETREIEIGVPANPELAPLPAGRYLEVRVIDSGTGIPEAVQERVFDPFFTTKPTGEGCGMGLAVAYAIVRNHHGAIRFHSRRGQGTTFTVMLPLQEAQDQPGGDDQVEQLAGQGNILFVDDEEVLRETAEVLLGSVGYRVTTVGSAAEAIGFYREHGAEIDLVVLDLSMPTMSGEKCFHLLREIDPQVRVLFSSGYGLDELEARLGKYTAVSFLEKPYDVARLSEAVAQALAARKSTTE